MRIDNGFLTGITVGATAQTARMEKTSVRAKKTIVSEHTSSQELAHLYALMGQEPETRPEVVHQAEERLASGFYGEPERATETAKAMLDAGD